MGVAESWQSEGYELLFVLYHQRTRLFRRICRHCRWRLYPKLLQHRQCQWCRRKLKAVGFIAKAEATIVKNSFPGAM